MLGDVAYDVNAIRKHFPALDEGAAHFDGPGGSQVPDVVGEAVAATLCSAISNRGTITPRSAAPTASSATPVKRWPTCWPPSPRALSSGAA